MNHVQFLHAGVVQNLHSPGMQNLHAGCQNAENARSPGVEICYQARVQKLHAGRVARMQKLHVGERENFAFRLECRICTLARRKRYTR